MSTKTKRTRAGRLIGVVTALALLVVPPMASAYAEDPEPEAKAIGRAAALRVDAAIIAADHGWGEKATGKHLRNQEAFAEVVAEVEQRFPGKFAGSVFAARPGGTSHVYFKGAVPAAAETTAEDSGLKVELTGGRPYSANELQQRSVEAVQFYADLGYEQVSSAVLANGLIGVGVTGEKKPGSRLPEHLRDGIRVRFVEDDVVVNEHTYGGARVRNTTTGSTCTSGFTVASLTTGTTGATTAAHCSGMNEYRQPNTAPAIDYGFTFQTQHEGLLGDVEWHTGDGHVEEAEYYASPSDLREVNAVDGWISVNESVCVYSRVQGTRNCDQVYSTLVNSFTSGGLVSSLVATDNDNTVAGDSGGPWSYSTTATGGHRGDQWIWFGTRNVFSRASLFPLAIGVAVLVQ
jgi:hypothetical protein